MPENIEEVKLALFNASKHLLEAGSIVMPHNHPLGISIVKLAEALTIEIDILSGNTMNSCDSGSCSTGSKLSPKLTDDMISEIEELEKELVDDLDL